MRRSRTRSYALMLAGGLAGGVLGAAFDQVTVTVSPAYFVLGKGLGVVIDPFNVREDSLGALGAREASRYLVAWGAHVGVYMGVILAVVGMAAQARARGSHGVPRGA